MRAISDAAVTATAALPGESAEAFELLATTVSYWDVLGNTALQTMNPEWTSLKIPSPESRTAPCDREPLSHIDRELELKLFGNP